METIDRMSPDSVLIQHDVSWDDYEELLEGVGEATNRRICYDEGTLQVMSPSSKHERYERLIGQMVGLLSVRLRIRVLHYGSSTIKKKHGHKGVEPDGCFYVENAKLVGTKDEIDFSTDPPPDIPVEIDIHHESISKFPIYAGLGVSEFWRYDGAALSIYHLSQGEYVAAEASRALPVLTAKVLTEFLARSPKEDQYDILLAFEEWLKGNE
ncbi:MAG: Uma2 family endonuclease [Pyrinomonadaceae bacterium]